METALETQAAAQPARQPTLLLVDDEANILSALRRLFRPHGYRVLTAEGGEEGLALLATEPVDLVISDMRMPKMDGAQFLAKVREGWPDVMRILLTGYADVTSTIDAINKGEIYRYISKPWEDNDVILQVKHALARKALEEENRRLEALTARQNEELRMLNASLEQKVKERTEALRKTLQSLEAAHEKLKTGFVTTVQVFSSMLELRAGALAGHARRVADHARALSKRLELAPAEAQDVFLAALLHDLAKIGLPDSVLNKSEALLSPEEKELLRQLPLKSAALLMPIEQLRGAARLIRSQRERFDGLGYPDGLSAMNIPMGARIIAVASDYHASIGGWRTGKCMSPKEALAYVLDGKARRYDPQVVDIFASLLAARDVSGQLSEVALGAEKLTEGMVLSRDVQTRDGLLLIARDYILDATLIAQLRNFEQIDGRPLVVFIRYPKESKHA